MTSETLILDRIVERLVRLLRSAAVDLRGVGPMPATLEEFDAMDDARQSAARALLKSFEQVQDQLARAIPPLVGEDPERWFARDYADYMEKARVLDDAGVWSRVVKLRAQLVHDYPLDPEVQFARFVDAVGYLPLLVEVHGRLSSFVRDELPGKLV